MEKKGKAGLEKIEKAIKLYGQNGFAASNKMTWADLGIFLLAQMISDIDASVIKQYPEVARVHATVGSYCSRHNSEGYEEIKLDF